MNRNIELTPNDKLGGKTSSYCGKCQKNTKHTLRSQLESSWNEGEISFTNYWQIIQCGGCDYISFRHEKYSSDSTGYIDGECVHLPDSCTFPNHQDERPPIAATPLIPADVRLPYIETCKAFSAKLDLLAQTGMRITLESICKDAGAEGRNLANKIDDLFAKKQLPAHRKDTFHEIRLIGNDAVHDFEIISRKKLSICLDIIDDLINQIYIIPKKYAKVPRRPARSS